MHRYHESMNQRINKKVVGIGPLSVTNRQTPLFMIYIYIPIAVAQLLKDQRIK